MAPELRAADVAVAAAQRARTALLAAVFAACCAPAGADQFACEVGGRHYAGDMPPTECSNAEIRQLNPDGSLKTIIPAPLTASQRRELDEKRKLELKQQEDEQARKRRDKALIEAYASEDEIVAERNRALLSRQNLIDRARERLHDFVQDHGKLMDEAEFYARRKMPPILKRKIEVNEESQRKEQKIIDDTQVETQRISRDFEEKIRRYHDLMDRTGAPRDNSATVTGPLTRSAQR